MLLGLASAGLAHAQASAPEVNPYTGEPATLESLTRQLETAKAQTAVLEERVKQAQLSMTLSVVPVKQQAELQELQAQAQRAARQTAPERKSEPEAEPEERAEEKKPAPRQSVEVQKPTAPVVSLSSVIRSGDGLVALIDVSGQTMAVRSGEQTPFGSVEILGETRVRLGDRTLSINEFTLTRFEVSDPAATGAAFGGMPGVVLPPPIPAPR